MPGVGKGAGGTGLTIHVRAGNQRQEQSIKSLDWDALLLVSRVYTYCTAGRCAVSVSNYLDLVGVSDDE